MLAFLDNLERERDFPTTSQPTLRIMRTNLCRNATWLAIRSVRDPAWARQMLRRAVSLNWRQALHPKILAGLGLSLQSPEQLRRVNQLVAKVRRRGHANYVGD